jgi:hypothetical protein
VFLELQSRTYRECRNTVYSNFRAVKIRRERC